MLLSQELSIKFRIKSPQSHARFQDVKGFNGPTAGQEDKIIKYHDHRNVDREALYKDINMGDGLEVE